MTQQGSVGSRILRFLGFDTTFRKSLPSMIHYNWAVFLANGSFYIIGLFFIPFLTKVEGLSTTQAGIVVLCAKLCDAVTDPLMGIVTDRTRSRFGRHRVYLLVGLVPSAVSYFMLWTAMGLQDSASGVKMAYFIGAYMLFSIAYTVVVVPHTAMLPVLAPQYDLRTQYNAMKTILDAIGTEGSFLIATLILSYTRRAETSVFGSVVHAMGHTPEFDPTFRHRFLLMGAVLSLFFSLPLLATFFGTKEPDSRQMPVPPFRLQTFLAEYRSIWSSKAFRQYFTLSFFNVIALGFVSNSSYYFLCSVAQMVELYTITNLISQAGEVMGFPLNYVLSIRRSKQTPARIELPFIVLALLVSFFVKPGRPKFLLILVYIFYNFGLAGVSSVTSNILPDVTDVDEMISGVRREGKIATFSTLVKKIVSGLAAAVTGLILGAFGFDAGASEQTATAIFGVRFTYAALPIALIIGSIITAHRYPMQKSDHALIRRAILEKHETGEANLTDEEKQICMRIAGQRWEDMWIGQPQLETMAICENMETECKNTNT